MKMTTGTLFMAVLAIAGLQSRAADDATSVARWSFEQVRDGTVADTVGMQMFLGRSTRYRSIAAC